LGALVEGWLLLVPKEHFLSFGAMPNSLTAEMQELKAATCARVQQAYGMVIAFEHGPSEAGRSVGCGVDHAHLHIVPVDFDLAAAVAAYVPPRSKWSKANLADCRRAFRKHLDYLYLEQPIGHGLIIQGHHLGSQLFRRAIAGELRIAEEYNWRTYPQLSNISKTIQTLGKAPKNDPDVFIRSEYAA